MNQLCNEYLAEKEGLTTEDVFYLVRFALSGNPVGASMADIAEVVGKEQCELRILQAQQVFN